MFTLEKIFCDGAVLQRDREIAVFGTGNGKIYGEFCGNTTECNAENGKFRLTFPKTKAGGPYELKVYSNDHSVTLHNILVGDVIFYSGQSNAELTVEGSAHTEEDAVDCDFIREYHVRHITEPNPDIDEKWMSASKNNYTKWCAIGYHLAKMMYKENGVPVGILCCAQGAGVIQSFMSPAALKKYDYYSFDGDTPISDEKKLADAHPDHLYEQFREFNKPSAIYHFMFERVIPYTVCAATWYQGESNTSVREGKEYEDLLKTFIAECRENFENKKLPFVIIQINNLVNPADKEGWKLVQKAQEMAAEHTEYAELVKITDLGEYEIIHPTRKKEVAERVFDKLKMLMSEWA